MFCLYSQTDAEFAECIGDNLAEDNFRLYPGQTFKDTLFPWFEPRIAPRSIDDLHKLLKDPVIADRLRQTDIEYLVWLDGTTETAEPVFWAVAASWETVSNYEATVWDLHRTLQVGKVSAEANGTSIVLLAIVPVPMFARPRATACNRLAEQLRELLKSPNGVVPSADEQIQASGLVRIREPSRGDMYRSIPFRRAHLPYTR